MSLWWKRNNIVPGPNGASQQWTRRNNTVTHLFNPDAGASYLMPVESLQKIPWQLKEPEGPVRGRAGDYRQRSRENQ